MRARLAILLCLLPLACSRAPEARQYELTGQVLAVRPERNEVVIRHDDIKGFMPGMTMPFAVKDPSLLMGLIAGDLVKATLVVADASAYLSALARTGHARLEEPPPPPLPDVLDPGETVADARLVDQDGRPASLASFRGHRVALTFIYTRCPLPDFCPLMDRHFLSVQRSIQSTPALSDVRLVTVTLDPEYDTPPVLKAYAGRVGADPTVWSYLTGSPEEIRTFGEQFGLYVERNPQSAIDITHNLRTAVIDPQGRLVAIHTGNSWTPADLVADLAKIPAAVQ